MAIIADEVFLDYSLAKDPPLTFSSNSTVLTFTLSGLSKISGLPQMKIAWIAANGPQPLLSDAMNRLEVIADTYLSMNAPLQWAVPVMLEERHSIQHQLLQRIAANLTLLDSQLASQELCRRAGGRGRMVCRVASPSVVLRRGPCHRIAARDRSAGAAWAFLRLSHADGYLVISLITPDDEFAEGIRRLLAFVAGLHS